jgi:hypothetical protein
MTTTLTRTDRDALRDAEDAVLQAQSRVRELSYLVQNKQAKDIINTTSTQIADVFSSLRDRILILTSTKPVDTAKGIR